MKRAHLKNPKKELGRGFLVLIRRKDLSVKKLAWITTVSTLKTLAEMPVTIEVGIDACNSWIGDFSTGIRPVKMTTNKNAKLAGEDKLKVVTMGALKSALAAARNS